MNQNNNPTVSLAGGQPPAVVIFLGPTLPRRLAQEQLPGADYRPPAGQGDVLRAVLDGARAIGVVDGYFEEVPAVWHKEFLYALHRGVAVFGASSMGALRAAELHPFGMVGVGDIFAAYRDGQIEDDDEVAVIHGPAELGYPALSDAMVNIRATLARAVTENILPAVVAAEIAAVAKALPYRQRHWDALTQHFQNHTGCGIFADWLPTGRIDQKRRDAFALLDTLKHWRTAGEPAPAARFHFEHTTLFDRALRDVATLAEP